MLEQTIGVDVVEVFTSLVRVPQSMAASFARILLMKMVVVYFVERAIQLSRILVLKIIKKLSVQLVEVVVCILAMVHPHK